MGVTSSSAFDPRLSVKAGDHFLHQGHDVVSIRTIGNVVTAGVAFRETGERIDHQDKSGFAIRALRLAIEKAIQCYGHGLHLLATMQLFFGVAIGHRLATPIIVVMARLQRPRS